MDSVFPFGLPAPTAYYLTLYVVTFALHQAFMHYVVAGSLYVAWATLVPGGGEVRCVEQPLATVLRDWMPFLLSAAITAGVAPLLFIQIVYERNFYTANLLLGWRWMLVVPVLIVAFYLLYLIKSAIVLKWSPPARAAVVLIAAGCLLFVGFCWTANHLLSNNETAWQSAYADNRVPLEWPAILCRMFIWIGGSFATLSVIAGWQLATFRAAAEKDAIDSEARRLAYLSLAGLGVAFVASVIYLLQSGDLFRGHVLGTAGLPYLIAAIVGVAIQACAWVLQLRRELCRRWLALAAYGCVLTLLGASVLRELIRIATIDIASLYAEHAEAAQIGGLAVFLAFAAINFSLIAICIWLVRRCVSETRN